MSTMLDIFFAYKLFLKHEIVDLLNLLKTLTSVHSVTGKMMD